MRSIDYGPFLGCESRLIKHCGSVNKNYDFDWLKVDDALVWEEIDWFVFKSILCVTKLLTGCFRKIGVCFWSLC